MFNLEHPENFHITFIVYKRKILSIGLNDSKTSPINLLNPKTDRNGQNISQFKGRCSELKAILNLKNKTNIPFKKTTLINVRINRNKRFDLAFPCQSCRSLLTFFEFKSIIVTDKDGSFKDYIKI